jgi:hypothetical protein
MTPQATSVCGLRLLVYEALSYKCVRPAASVWGLELLVYTILSYWCMRPQATSPTCAQIEGSESVRLNRHATTGMCSGLPSQNVCTYEYSCIHIYICLYIHI